MESGSEFLSALEDISNHCQEIESLRNELSVDKGISLLKLKNEVFQAYMKNLMFIILLRTQNQSIVDHPCVKRLVEYRVVLERIRPLENKLKFQIDRALKTATSDVNEVDTEGLNARLMEMTENIDDDDLSSDENSKENGDESNDDSEGNSEELMDLEEMASEDDGEDNESECDEDEEKLTSDDTDVDDEECEDDTIGMGDEDDDYIDSDTVDGEPEPSMKKKSKKSKDKSENESNVYRPPKLNPAFYADSKEAGRAQKEMQRAKARAMRSSLLEDIHDENEVNPKETFETANLMNKIQIRKEKERQIYEEEYFTRLTLSKKEKTERDRVNKGDPLDKIGNFEEIRTLLGDDEYPELKFRKDGKKSTKKEKKRLQKMKSKGKSKGKKFKKMKRK